jgi:translation initiation factor IF-2
MVDDINNKTDEKKATRKTLSISGLSSVNLSKDNDTKTRNVRGRSVAVETKGKKKNLTNNLSIDNDKLTNEEKERRQKVLEISANNPVDSSEDVKNMATIQIVIKEPIVKLEVAQNENLETEIAPEETLIAESNHNAIMKKSVEMVHNKSDINVDFEEDLKAKKNKADKKKLLEEEEKRKSNPNNWKNSYAINNDDEDDDEVESQFIEDEEQQKPKFTSGIKRKNKYYHKNNSQKTIKNINIYSSVSVKKLALDLSEKAIVLIKSLQKLDMDVKEDDIIEPDIAVILGEQLGHKINYIQKKSIEEEFLHYDDLHADFVDRAPVVAIMGHVDHGKTTLLDTIRKSNVVSKESGGITQHIGAYQVKTSQNKLITFLDTPGHEAFSQIRSRGSKITDIVIIVVAADDGVKPQTIEAINHAKSADVPMIIAINKIDKPDKNIQKLKTELLQQNIVLEDLGGDVLSVEISAKANLGIDKLLETILLQSEMLELKTNLKAPAKASVIEVKVAKGFGCLATILVERGVLKIGDLFVCGTIYGKIKVMMNDKGEKLKEAFPSMPIEISGFEGIVQAGDDFIVVPNEAKLNELLEYKQSKAHIVSVQSNKVVDINSLLSQDFSDVKMLSVIIKTDTQGSLEAILGSIAKIKHPEIEIKIMHSGVGEISESDVMMAKIGKAILMGFHSRANSKARDIAKKDGIEIRYHSIIYNLIDDLKLILSGLLDPNIVENIIGYAEIREVFSVTKVGKIAGCFVTEGNLKRSAFVRVLRKNVVIHDGTLSQLKRFKDDAKEVKQSFECGVMLEGYNDIVVGDIIECYEKIEVKNELK